MIFFIMRHVGWHLIVVLALLTAFHYFIYLRRMSIEIMTSIYTTFFYQPVGGGVYMSPNSKDSCYLKWWQWP